MKKSTQFTKYLVLAVVILLAGNLFAAIPASERAALIALYNSTNGDNWFLPAGWKSLPLDDDGFAMPGTEGGWAGITVAEVNGTEHVTEICLNNMRLEGTIPVEIGAFFQLTVLNLEHNRLSGSIPAELTYLLNLTQLRLGLNQLSGSIPSLKTLFNLTRLSLNCNQLSGSIPFALGDLHNLTILNLECNQLSGSIPITLFASQLTALYLGENQFSGALSPLLRNLKSLSFLDISYNAFYTTDAELRTFLDTKDPDWEDTQTVAPSDIIPAMTGPDQITLSWTPILYTGDTGGYHVYYSQTSGGPYTLAGTTANKSATSLAVSGLTAGVTYYFVVQTQTDPHGFNSNTLLSKYSSEVSGEIDPERAALITLYNSTNGDNWTNNSGWKTAPLAADGFAMPGTEGGWFGITVAEVSGADHVTVIDMSLNNLVGTIPVEAGQLNHLWSLDLSRNKLSGTIPKELGNLGDLLCLYLDGNMLRGSIPTELTNLTSLQYNPDIGHNALYTDDTTLRNFLDYVFWFWEDTQTIAPTNITTTISGADEITISWTPIYYTSDTGGYHVYYSQTSGGPYTLAGTTANKSATAFPVSGLTAGVTYYFVVQTQTNPHSGNANTVLSDSSEQVEGIIPTDATKMIAAPLAGLPGTTVQFSNACGGKVNRFLWDFGDGCREGYRHGTMAGQKVHPSHTYGDAGDFTVALITSGWESAPPDTLTMPNFICMDPDYAPLAVVEGTETHSGYGWAKTIDQDVFNISSKMTADLPDVECVYSFSDSSIRNVSRVRLFIDDVYQTNYPGHLTGKFEVWVSVDNVLWTQALATSIPWQYRGQFANFTFPPVLGRFVKLKLTEPHNPNANIIQLTEFQVFGAKGEDTPLEKGLLADNSPVTEFALAQNYPNPFNPTTTINFALPEAANVSLRVYNVAGQMVAELVNGHQDAGRHQVVFDAGSLSSGIYFCVMRAANVEQVNRMILMK